MNKQGYFSIVQYSENPERIEFVNIGIVLFSPFSPRVMMRFSESPRRVERVFGVSLGAHFQLLKQSLEHRLSHDFGGDWGREQIEKFIALRSGKVRLAPARSVLVDDAELTLSRLFGEVL